MTGEHSTWAQNTECIELMSYEAALERLTQLTIQPQRATVQCRVRYGRGKEVSEWVCRTVQLNDWAARMVRNQLSACMVRTPFVPGKPQEIAQEAALSLAVISEQEGESLYYSTALTQGRSDPEVEALMHFLRFFCEQPPVSRWDDPDENDVPLALPDERCVPPDDPDVTLCMCARCGAPNPCTNRRCYKCGHQLF